MKKLSFWVMLFLVSGSGIFLIQCDSGSSTDSSTNSGGAGADIDATSVKQIWYANTVEYQITSMGYSGGAGPWTEASLCMGIVMQIEAYNSSAEHRYIQFAYGDSSAGACNPVSFSLDPGERLHFQAIIRLNTPTSGDRLWVNDTYSNISGVTIRVMPIFWLKNITS